MGGWSAGSASNARVTDQPPDLLETAVRAFTLRLTAQKRRTMKG